MVRGGRAAVVMGGGALEVGAGRAGKGWSATRGKGIWHAGGEGARDLIWRGGEAERDGGGKGIAMAHLPGVRHKYIHSNGAPPWGAP